MKSPKCPCCRQSGSPLRKVECDLCGTYAMQSRAQISNGLLSCHCGGKLEPVCLLDRARCFDGTEYGREAWAEYAYRFPSQPDPWFSDRSRKAAQTRKRREAWANVRVATDPIPF